MNERKTLKFVLPFERRHDGSIVTELHLLKENEYGMFILSPKSEKTYLSMSYVKKTNPSLDITKLKQNKTEINDSIITKAYGIKHELISSSFDITDIELVLADFRENVLSESCKDVIGIIGYDFLRKHNIEVDFNDNMLYAYYDDPTPRIVDMRVESLMKRREL